MDSIYREHWTRHTQRTTYSLQNDDTHEWKWKWYSKVKYNFWTAKYNGLWYKDDAEMDYSNIDDDDFAPYEGDLVMIEEYEAALRKTKNWKVTGQDGLNTEFL